MSKSHVVTFTKTHTSGALAGAATGLKGIPGQWLVGIRPEARTDSLAATRTQALLLDLHRPRRAHAIARQDSIESGVLRRAAKACFRAVDTFPARNAHHAHF